MYSYNSLRSKHEISQASNDFKKVSIFGEEEEFGEEEDAAEIFYIADPRCF